MSGWRKDDEIHIKVKVDKQGILGHIAKIAVIEDQLREEVDELRRLICAEEMASPNEERSQDATDSDKQ